MNLKLAVISLSAVVLAGCATSAGKPMDVIDADRAGGIVKIGMVHSGSPLWDDGEKARWEDALPLAIETCKRWGYDTAEPLSRHTRSEGLVNGYGQLVNGSIYKQFQCVRESEISRP